MFLLLLLLQKIPMRHEVCTRRTTTIRKTTTDNTKICDKKPNETRMKSKFTQRQRRSFFMTSCRLLVLLLSVSITTFHGGSTTYGLVEFLTAISLPPAQYSSRGLGGALLLFGAFSPSSSALADEENELLDEILAEERRQEEEHAEFEAETRLYETLVAQQQQRQDEAAPKTSRMNMPPGARLNKNFESLQRDIRNKEEELLRQKQQDTNDVETRQREQRIKERELLYEAQLKQISDTKVRKALQRQKARDGRIVKRILKASASNRHYLVLGLRLRYILAIALHRISLFQITTPTIKAAYRRMARKVHPDKNKDGRAELAFDALERSSSILSNEVTRRDYDLKAKKMRRERREHVIRMTSPMVGAVTKGMNVVWACGKKLLGPFSLPILVLGTLAI